MSRARDHQLGREVALKRLKEECVTQAAVRARFLREAWITGQLQHPGIVPVFELGTLPDLDEPFYTMRFIEGPTLSAAVAEFHRKRSEGTTGPLDLRKLLGSFVSACQVVAYAHSRRVIHRDLKGQNIVLGDYGEVIVLDWGLAKVVGGALAKPGDDACEPRQMVVAPPAGVFDETIDGSVLGTPAYMPPEQALGRIDQLDERSDVYGMGAILYEILTGEPPFRGTREEVLRQVVSDPPVRPRYKVHDVPEALEAICLKCLAKTPDDRYRSAAALADDIQRFLGGEPVSVHRETRRAKARRWASRHRTLVAATLATLFVATGSLAVATALLRMANSREAAARSEAEKNLSVTLRTVDSFFTHVADAPSLKTFGLEKFQREVLTEGEKVIRQLVEVQTRASDVSAEHGRCCLRLSLITGMLGDPESATRYAMQARTIFAKLSENKPQRRAEHLRGLAESLDALGLAHEGAYRLDQAEAAHEQAAKVWESLVTDSRVRHELAYRLAASLNRRGRLLCVKLGDPRGAQRVLSLARERGDQLVSAHPASADYIRERAKAMVLTGVAMSSDEIKEIDRATALFEEALPQFEKLAGDQPGNTEVQADLVDACALIAAAYSNARLEGRITTIYEQVRNIAQRLVREHPDVPSFAENNALIEAMHSIKIALRGNHRLAVELLTEALKGVGKSGLARMFAACCLSVASDVAARDPALGVADREILVERYQARAVALLREAKETGLFFQPHQLEGVRSKDPDLKWLREAPTSGNSSANLKSRSIPARLLGPAPLDRQLQATNRDERFARRSRPEITAESEPSQRSNGLHGIVPIDDQVPLAGREISTHRHVTRALFLTGVRSEVNCFRRTFHRFLVVERHHRQHGWEDQSIVSKDSVIHEFPGDPLVVSIFAEVVVWEHAKTRIKGSSPGPGAGRGVVIEREGDHCPAGGCTLHRDHERIGLTLGEANRRSEHEPVFQRNPSSDQVEHRDRSPQGGGRIGHILELPEINLDIVGWRAAKLGDDNRQINVVTDVEIDTGVVLANADDRDDPLALGQHGDAVALLIGVGKEDESSLVECGSIGVELHVEDAGGQLIGWKVVVDGRTDRHWRSGTVGDDPQTHAAEIGLDQRALVAVLGKRGDQIE